MKKIDLKYCTKCGHKLEKRVIEKKERMYCRYCDTIYYDNPIPVVALVGRNENGQLLLVKRKVEPKKGFWALPGGFMDSGESSIQAVLREMEEETGLRGNVERLIDIYNHESKMYGYVIIIIYEVTIIGGELKAGDDAECADFFDIDKIPHLAFNFHEVAVKQIIEYS
jgi:8-oxo-dGTP diphosphatase